jgi:SAM-dependent methyltransferase
MNLRTALKNIVRPIYNNNFGRYFVDNTLRFFWYNRPLRKYFTRNFTSGYLAVGEQNKYCVSPEWITLDISNADFNYDIREHNPFPFADDSVSIIYSSHMVEHLPENTCFYFFEEAHRILKKGGVLRVEGPDTEKLVEEYKNGNELFFMSMLSKEEKKQYGKSLHFHDVFVGQLSCFIEQDIHLPVRIPKNEVDEKIQILSPSEFADWCISFQTNEQKQSGGHINSIYFDKLEKGLKLASFKKIHHMKVGKSSHPIMEGKLPGIEREHRDYFSIYVEANK